MVHIIKPGVDPMVTRPDKTNLQLRELQMLRSALRLAEPKLAVDIITVNDLRNNLLTYTGDTFFVFNAGHAFDTECIQIFDMLSVLASAHVILVSNDCRLSFAMSDNAIGRFNLHTTEEPKSYKLTCITNATRNLEQLPAVIGIDKLKNIVVFSTNLYTLPAYLQHEPAFGKTTDIVYACMHYRDYDKHRTDMMYKLLSHIRYEQENKQTLQFFGDTSGLRHNGQDVKANVIDAKNLSAIYAQAKTTPVLLEATYVNFGIIPNRVAEAIANDCLPIIVDAYDKWDESDEARKLQLVMQSLAQTTYKQFAVCEDYTYMSSMIKDDAGRYKQLVRLHTVLNNDIRLFERQLRCLTSVTLS